MSSRLARALAAIGAGLVAFLLYHATLVPGMDLGDSASFQADVGARLLTPRHGYPLYFAINSLVGRAVIEPGAEPARAANLASAICGAVAIAILTIVVSELAQSVLAGLFAGLLFAASYTFWSQCVTAEVYALHMTCVGATLLLLRRWADSPSLARLTIAFAIYAIAFGNHLSMILLAPAIVLFIALTAGWRTLVRPSTIVAAVATAALGATQYAWNVAGMLAMPDVPPGADAVRAFWFDVTKTDWRESMVYATPSNMFGERMAMYWFDLRQQFGVAGMAIAVMGAIALAFRRPRDFVLLAVAFAVNWLFAFTYNVGDVHVFFLPSHLMVAIAAGYGVALLIDLVQSRHGPRLAIAVGVIALAYPAWRAYDTFPAVDRSHDRRGERVLEALTHDLTADNAILFADLNWQLQNGLSYFAKYRRPDLPYLRSADRLLAFPVLVDDNLAMGRGVYLTSSAKRRVGAAYGSAFAIDVDPANHVRQIAAIADELPEGTSYVFTLLTPYRDRPLDPSQPPAVMSALTAQGNQAPVLPLDGYSLVAGVKGIAPTLVRSAARPFSTSIDLAGRRIVVRFDAWLAYDTIRRADFGHVIADHRHALPIDRGMSFVAWVNDQTLVAYESSMYAEQPRYVLRP